MKMMKITLPKKKKPFVIDNGYTITTMERVKDKPMNQNW